MRDVWRPLLFVGWLVGALFGVPLVAASLGASDWVTTSLGTAALVLPLCYWIASRGSGQEVRDRTVRIASFVTFAAVLVVIGLVATLGNHVVLACTSFGVGFVMGSAAIANARSRPVRQWHS